MYKKLNITENGLQVLALFTHGFDRDYYIREVEKILNISPRTAQLTLENLESKGLLESKIRGKIKTFKLVHCELTKKYLVFVEQYKALLFLERKPVINAIIEKISPHINGIGIVFGSYVKNLEKKGSDLDVFIVGEFDEEEIKKISKIYGIENSVKCYPLKIFEKNLKNDVFLKEILKNHIVFLNVEKFIDVLFENE